MNIRGIADSLAAQAETVCRDLLPNGKVEAGAWRNGSIDPDDKGRSFSCELKGNRAGLWTDHSTGQGGDLLNLIERVMNCNLTEAMRYAERRYGVANDTPARKFFAAEKKTYQSPKIPKVINSDVLHKYMEGRGFSDPGEIVAKFNLKSSKRQGGTDVVFPFYTPDKELAMIKTKPMDYKGHPQPTSRDQRPVLFGWQALDENTRSVWITEGEWDAVSLSYCGFAALSVPFGGGGGNKQLNWIEQEFHHLDRFEEIVIATDMDEVGEAAAQTIMERLGDRCIRVKLPEKDANEVLQKYGDQSAEMFLKAYETAKWQDPETLHNAAEFEDDIALYFEPADSNLQGWESGWEKLQGKLRFRPAELWILNGINGHGKSMWLSQLCLDAVKADQKICKASMEMHPRNLLGRMIRQASGTSIPSQAYRKVLLDWMAPNLWLFIDSSTTKQDVLFTCFEYAFRRYGCSLFVVDSLTNCGLGYEDYDAQKRFVERLVDFKNRFGVTVILVTHSRKGESEYKMTGKFDIRGAGAIVDLADGLLTLWRNKKKQNHLDECVLLNEEPDPEIASQWDVSLICDKNRNGDWEGRVGFAFDAKTFQYRESDNAHPKHYVEFQQ